MMMTPMMKTIINISTKVILCNNPYNVLRGFMFWTVYMMWLIFYLR